MGWRILVNFISRTNIRQPMSKLKTHFGFHDLFLISFEIAIMVVGNCNWILN